MQQEAEGRGCFSAASVCLKGILFSVCSSRAHLSDVPQLHKKAVKTIKTYKPYH